MLLKFVALYSGYIALALFMMHFNTPVQWSMCVGYLLGWYGNRWLKSS